MITEYELIECQTLNDLYDLIPDADWVTKIGKNEYAVFTDYQIFLKYQRGEF
jgi:hypothetical protein